jgi:hypothetical protein
LPEESDRQDGSQHDFGSGAHRQGAQPGKHRQHQKEQRSRAAQHLDRHFSELRPFGGQQLVVISADEPTGGEKNEDNAIINANAMSQSANELRKMGRANRRLMMSIEFSPK